MKNYKRSDLAAEAADDLEKIEGTEISHRVRDGIEFERIEILTESAARRLAKKCGTYITVTISAIWSLDDEEIKVTANAIGEELGELLRSSIGADQHT